MFLANHFSKLAIVFHVSLLLKVAGEMTRTKSAIDLTERLLRKYDKKMKPTTYLETSINVTYSLDLYQIHELNEPQQYVLLNVWVIEKWYDEILYWDPQQNDNVTELILPYDVVWRPDTTLYNSILMKDEEIRRLLNVKLTHDAKRHATLIEMLYPAVYKFSCLLNLHYFPFDIQICTITVSSWTHDKTGIDYFFAAENIGRSNFLENEAWELLKTSVKREEKKYACCEHEYTLLRMTLYLRRKPLFYLVNLIIPISIITLISIFGFFTSSSASEVREEKVSLGLTTLLSMSILLLMVSDEIPTTSTFIPLMGWYILSMIVLTAMAVFATAVVIHVQKKGSFCGRLSPPRVRTLKYCSELVRINPPLHLVKGTEEFENAPPWRLRTRLRQLAARSAFLYGALSPFPNGQPATSSIDTERYRRGRTNSAFENVATTGQRDSPTTTSISADERKAISTERLPLIPLVPLGSGHCDGQQQAGLNRDRSLNTSQLMEVINESKEKANANKKLAKIEFEWLASVAERWCFLVFLSLFALLNVGINLIGFIQWLTWPDDIA